MKPDASEAKTLLNLALRDKIAFTVLLQSTLAARESAFFHAQQCVEKCLKAVIVYKGEELKKIHDLSALAEQVTQCGELIPATFEELTDLTPYAVLMRYDDQEFVATNADAVSSVVETIYHWADNIVKH